MKRNENFQAGRANRYSTRDRSSRDVYGNTKPAAALTRAPLRDVGRTNTAVKQIPRGHARPITKPQDRIFSMLGLRGPIPNYDDVNQYDPLRKAEYARDIFSCMLDKEESHILSERFVEDCRGISSKERSTLLNWLVALHTRLAIPTESLWLMVSYLDHYIARKGSIRPEHLLHTGVACLLLADKWEQQRPGILDEVIPTLKASSDSFRTPCRCRQGPPRLDRGHKVPFCGKCTSRVVEAIERNVWEVMGHDMNVPTAVVFMRRYAVVGEVSDLVRYTGFYLSELCFQEPALAKYRPSRLAAACLSLA
ncbi:hypothetical protein KIPB_009406, partial [Kipferlia bialata]|eukprot:g9406.t1